MFVPPLTEAKFTIQLNKEIMADQNQLDILNQGAKAWNEWRKSNKEIKIDLKSADLSFRDLAEVNLHEADIHKANFAGANLHRAFLVGVYASDANFEQCNLYNAIFSSSSSSGGNFKSAILTHADLSSSSFFGANFRYADLSHANLIRADLRNAYLNHANLSDAYLQNVNLHRAKLHRTNLKGADLESAILSQAYIKDAVFTDCRIFGLSTWDTRGVPENQANLIVTQRGEAEVTVDDLQMGQLVYFLLKNRNIRTLIDTITSKTILILGRFTDERKAVLKALQQAIREKGYLPILFDFTGPENRDITETVSTLAHLARFVIADITDAKSILQELRGIVPELPSLPVKPILLSSQEEPGMFGFFRRFPWVLDTFYYRDINDVVSSLEDKIIKPLEENFLRVKPR
jgi:uncharacterized protein YjbI with pentapeptide repeats